MSKRGGKRVGAGRRPMPQGEGKVRKTLSLSPEAAAHLDTLHNMSAYVDALIKEDMAMQPIKTSIGAIADHWGSEPSEWGLYGTLAVVEGRKTPAKFERDEDGEWQLWVQYPDESWDSPSQERWQDTDVQGLR